MSVQNRITGKEYSISRIFSSDFDYYIPKYQRPYAWTKEEAGTLFDDLYKFYCENPKDNYFLGSIVLVKSETNSHAEVIDGQQRLTTLTILLACLAYTMSGNIQQNCLDYLRERGNDLEGLKPTPRLHLRDKDQPFFESYIQNLNLDKLLSINASEIKTEAQQRIYENCTLFLDNIKEKFQDKKLLQSFCSFLVTRCYLVVVYTASQDSAFRVFSVLNSRGLDLQTTDILKSEIIGSIPEDQQQKYTDLWEELEIQTSRTGFNDVFMHIRTIFAKNKQKKSLLEEFKEYVSQKFEPDNLIEKIIKPYTSAYNMLKKGNYPSNNNADKINNLLNWLNKFDNSDWLPVAMKFYTENYNDSEYILWFTQKLERLASYLYATSKDVNKRISRYSLILAEIEQNPNHNLSNPLKSIELTKDEIKEFLAALNGNIYTMIARRRNYIILRLNDFVSDGASEIQSNIFTIEHVLPQTITPDSEWEKNWPKIDDREKWLNKIANLVPLTKYHNSAAQNYDFNKKKDCYFKNAKGVTSYPLTTQVLMESSWTPEVVECRQNKLLEIFKDKWELTNI